MKKQNEIEVFSGITALILSAAALILFCLSYTTNYYTFGQMNSVITAALLGAAIAVETAALIARSKRPDSLVVKTLTLFVTGFLSAASMLLLGDRVEGIGICIVTDYDSGHGGEEAIYMSIAASILMIAAVVYNIVGSFCREKAQEEAVSANRTIARLNVFIATGLIVLLAVVIPTAVLVRKEAAQADEGGAGAGTKSANETVYKVNYSQDSGNAEETPAYQFLCGDVSGLIQYDARMNVDITLSLKEDGTYSLTADSYVIEAGEKAVVGDSTGIGMTMKMTAEGEYVKNDDGTITTKKAGHAVFELETDTYSSQMKDVIGISIGGSNEDGVYDSEEYPEILEYVPETQWTVEGEAIVSYQKAGAEENGQAPAEGGTQDASDENAQALADQNAQDKENSGASSGSTAEIKAEVSSVDGATTMTFYADGTYRFYFAQYSVEDKGTYTYDGTTLTVANANGQEMKAQGDPLELHYISSMSDALTGDYSIKAAELQ